MLRLTIAGSIAVLLCGGGFARGQERPNPSQASKPPSVIYKPDPECSSEALKAKIEGAVVLRVVVGADGLVHDISAVKTVGYGLDEEAIKAVKKWRFKPAEVSGRPATVHIMVEVKFRCPM